MKNPCHECLVKPICNVSCTKLFNYYTKRIDRIAKIKRYLPITAAMSSFMFYVFCVWVEIFDDGTKVLTAGLIISAICLSVMWLDNKYFAPKLRDLKNLLDLAAQLSLDPRR